MQLSPSCLYTAFIQLSCSQYGQAVEPSLQHCSGQSRARYGQVHELIELEDLHHNRSQLWHAFCHM